MSPTALRCYSMSLNSTTDSNKYHGQPCKYCGSTLRYKSGSCIACTKRRANKYRRDNPEKERIRNKKTYQDNRENEIERKRLWYQTNKERAKANTKAWRDNNKDKVREYSRKWKKNNPEKILESARDYRRNNRERVNEVARKWSKENLHNGRKQAQRRRARERNAKIEHYDFESICAHYNNRCVKCGRDDTKLTIDHIKPIALGGNDIASNIQPLCGSCNSAKGARNSIDYRPDAGPLRWVQRKLFT